MTKFLILIQTFGIAGASAFCWWLYLFICQQMEIMSKKNENENENEKEKEKEKDKNPGESTTIVVKEIEYEDKYLEKFNKMENVYSFQEEDLELQEKKIKELLDVYNQENAESYECDSLKIEEIKQIAKEYVIQHFLSRLKNAYIIENTPIGNVAMNFNSEKGSFEYYSDKNIPYRFLEIVSRKYVTTYFCKPLYIVMDVEIEAATQKLKEEKEKNELMKKSLLQRTSAIAPTAKLTKTKDIFANFKSGTCSGNPIQINKMPSNKNIGNKSNIKQFPSTSTSTTNNASQILKENANRYTHLGKFSNFILLKAVNKIHYDKNYKMSYRDFLLMNKTNN